MRQDIHPDRRGGFPKNKTGEGEYAPPKAAVPPIPVPSDALTQAEADVTEAEKELKVAEEETHPEVAPAS